MKKILLTFCVLIFIPALSQSQTFSSDKPVGLPSALINGRFFLKLPTPSGDTLLAFCDTGGGFNAVYRPALVKSHLDDKIAHYSNKDDAMDYILFRDVVRPGFPAPEIPTWYRGKMPEPFLVIPEESGEIKVFLKYVQHDIFLGQYYFITHAWTFDYGSGKITVNTPLASGGAGTQLLGFKKDRKGDKLNGHPRMQVVIDGKEIEMLFDTGASILLSKASQDSLHAATNSIAGSFIAKSIFDKWREQHPGWRYLEKGEATGADMIEVPQVTYMNSTAGPVWFARRPDEAWSKGMITSMDKVVKGAIGGSFLQYYKVTIDYNSGLLRLEKIN